MTRTIELERALSEVPAGEPFLVLVHEPDVFARMRYAAGHVIESGRHLFVTTGVGTSILPVRLGVPPEIVLLELR